jgi:hypothetical protein
MTDKTDIYRAAHEYIKQYGDDADIQASMMADKMLSQQHGRPCAVAADHGCYCGVKDVEAAEGSAGALSYRMSALGH